MTWTELLASVALVAATYATVRLAITVVRHITSYGCRSLLEWRPTWQQHPKRKPGRHHPKPNGRVTSVPRHMTTVPIDARRVQRLLDQE